MSDNSNYDNTMNKLAGRITNIVLLGFFTTLLSLPIISAGGAFSALNASTRAYLYEDDDKPLRTFFDAFKSLFGLSTKIWLLHILVGVILVWDFVYYRTADTTIDILASAGIFVLLMFLIFEMTMVFVVVSEGKSEKVFETIKLALDISLYSPLQSLMIILLEIAVIVVTIFLFRGLILVFPGVIAYLSWQIIPKMLKRYKFRNS